MTPECNYGKSTEKYDSIGIFMDLHFFIFYIFYFNFWWQVVDKWLGKGNQRIIGIDGQGQDKKCQLDFSWKTGRGRKVILGIWELGKTPFIAFFSLLEDFLVFALIFSVLYSLGCIHKLWKSLLKPSYFSILFFMIIFNFF